MNLHILLQRGRRRCSGGWRPVTATEELTYKAQCTTCGALVVLARLDKGRGLLPPHKKERTK